MYNSPCLLVAGISSTKIYICCWRSRILDFGAIPTLTLISTRTVRSIVRLSGILVVLVLRIVV
jgi:hypothetical protein